MYIKFKKAHEGFKSGDTVETNNDRARAYVEAGLAEYVPKEKVQKWEAERAQEDNKEKNAQAGPNGKKK